MKTLEILCISLAAIGLILLYFQYKNQKTLEMMQGTMLAIQQPVHPISSDLVERQFLLNETQQLKTHIDAKTLDVHDHLNMVLQSIDKLYGEKKDDDTVQKRSYTEILDGIEGLDGIEVNDLNEPLQLNSLTPSHEQYQPQSRSISLNSQKSAKSNKSNTSVKSNKSTKSNKSLEEHDMNDIMNTTHAECFKSTNVSISTDSTLTKYPKLPELRLLCKSRNVSMVGSKKVLINRLIENGYEF